MSYKDYKDFHRSDAFIGLEIVTVEEETDAITIDENVNTNSAIIDEPTSGDIDYSNKIRIDAIIIKDKKEKHIEYLLEYIGNSWHIIPIGK